VIHWTKIAPADALGLVLPMAGVIGPVNELGEPCPWPWDPPQLAGAPIGQYHCPYCLGMVIAGMDHLDYTGTVDEGEAAYFFTQQLDEPMDDD
jgi:hypothetical protein